jgi:hypothetical protein
VSSDFLDNVERVQDVVVIKDNRDGDDDADVDAIKDDTDVDDDENVDAIKDD